MYIRQQAQQQILQELKKAVGKEFTPTVADLSTPPDQKLGDFSFPCFTLAKGLRQNPSELANEIAAKIGPKGFIRSIAAAGPYVNFFLEDGVFGGAVLEEIASKGAAYGFSKAGEGKRIMVEFAQPNTHKDIHIGHLRNFFVGQELVDVLKAIGYEVIPATYINDLGAHVATCLWGIQHLHAGETPTKSERIPFLGKAYADATKAAEEDSSVKAEISAIYQDLEQLRGPLVSLWKKTREWSLAFMRSVFKEAGLTLDVWYYESDLVDRTKKLIEELIRNGIAIHSEGAWIVDLESEGLGVNLLVKTNGTLLYNAKDLALAIRKNEDYEPMRSLYVIDARQSLAMRQLFATLKKMGFQKELAHISYEFVTLKDGAMSSRKGNIVRYEALRDQMIAGAREETKDRHPDWEEKKLEKAARALAFAAIRFGMLKQDLDKVITFDPEEALSFDGCTGPYLLYSFARIQSILKKGKKVKPIFSAKHLAAPVEHHLLSLLSQYPDVVFSVGSTYRLSALPQHLFEISKAFSEFYEISPVLQAKSTELIAERLGLVKSVAQVLENGLRLLGIQPIKEM